MPEVEDLQRAPAAAAAKGQRQISRQNFECSWFADQRQTTRTSGSNRPLRGPPLDTRCCRKSSASGLTRQIDCAATRTDQRIALPEGGSIPGTQLVKSCLLEDATDLVRIPADLFDAFVTPSPAASIPDEPFDIAPSPVGLAIMAVAHHDRHARLLEPDGARPTSLKSKGGVDVEEEVAAGPQCSFHGLGDYPQVCPSRNMIERIVFAGDQVHRFWQPETPHVGSKYAYRQAGTSSLLPGEPAHQWG